MVSALYGWLKNNKRIKWKSYIAVINSNLFKRWHGGQLARTNPRCDAFTAWTTRASNPVCSPCFLTSVLVGTQELPSFLVFLCRSLDFDPQQTKCHSPLSHFSELVIYINVLALWGNKSIICKQHQALIQVIQKWLAQFPKMADMALTLILPALSTLNVINFRFS